MSQLWPDELLHSCKRVHWSENAEKVLETPSLYLQHVMCYGNDNDVRVAKKHFTDENFVVALTDCRPGKFTLERWDRWREKLGLAKVPLPARYADDQRPHDWWRGFTKKNQGKRRPRRIN